MFIGAPGPINWRGTVFRNSIQLSLEGENNWYQSAVEDVLPGQNNPEPAMAGFYSYLGW